MGSLHIHQTLMWWTTTVWENQNSSGKKGKDILHNIQARQTMEYDMSRPPDPIQLQTTKSKSTGERAKTSIDMDYMEDEYDIEISNFDVDLGEFKETEEHFLEVEAIPRKKWETATQ